MDDTFPKKPRQVPVFPLPLRPGDPGYTDNHKNLCNRLYDNWYLQNTTSFLGSRWPTPISTPGEPIYSLEDGYRDRLSYEYFKKPVVPPLTSESDNNHQLSTGNLNELGTKEAWNNGDSRINVYRHSPVHCGILAFNTVPGLVRCDSDLENSECDARHTIKSQNNQYFERFHKLDGGLASCRSPSSLELGLYETSYGHSQAPCDICAQLSPKYISGENYKDDKSDHYFARDLSIVHFYQRDSSASTASCVRTCKSPHANSPTLSQILAPSTKYNNESPSINTPPGGDRAYRCDNPDCQKRFSRKEELTRHRRTHSNERDFECKICQRRFIRKDHMTKHQATHEDVSKRRRYVCPEQGCERRYTRSDALSRHRSSAHPYNNLLPAPPPHSMPVCV